MFYSRSVEPRQHRGACHRSATGSSLPRQACDAECYSVHADHCDDQLMAHTEIERGAAFCDDPACALHVRARDASVEGSGNWLALPDGRIFGRSRFGDSLLCDACGTRRGPVRLAAEPSQEAKRRRARQ